MGFSVVEVSRLEMKVRLYVRYAVMLNTYLDLTLLHVHLQTLLYLRTE